MIGALLIAGSVLALGVLSGDRLTSKRESRLIAIAFVLGALFASGLALVVRVL